jgi:hypothetical protein
MNDLWTFRGVAFRRVLSGDTDPQWFVRSVARTVDLIAATSTRIVDIGGVEAAPLSFVAWATTELGAQNLVAMLGTSGALTSPSGQSATALLVEATALVKDGLTHRVACTWEVL